ncbi:MAG: hypothetical protein GC150_01905 [Rhizobiales bacterium]|nr:hypothetical protein [Hyphomicrobiales bacterium]
MSEAGQPPDRPVEPPPGPVTGPYRTRLWALFASKAPVAVILRRGPKRHFHLIRWNLARGTFEHGQWMKGFVRLWDLSPDGEKLIYWAHQYHAPHRPEGRGLTLSATPGVAGAHDPLAAAPRNRSPKKGEKRRRVPRYMRAPSPGRMFGAPVRQNWGVWTAISTPPYFTALAIWPSFGHWTGGGVFSAAGEIVLNEGTCGLTPKLNVPLTNRVRIRSNEAERAAGTWPTFSAWHPWMVDRGVRDEVIGWLRATGAEWVDWIAPRPDGTLYIGADGCLWRIANWRDRRPEAWMPEAERLLDLNPLSFTLLAPPPDAMVW